MWQPAMPLLKRSNAAQLRTGDASSWLCFSGMCAVLLLLSPKFVASFCQISTFLDINFTYILSKAVI
jgi:hypothetical protein